MQFQGLAAADAEKAPVPFLYTSLNYAWVYQHSGMLVDSSGVVMRFSFDRSDSIGFFGVTDTLTTSIYEKLIEFSEPTGRVIDPDTLRSMTDLILPASMEDVVFEGMCADYGIRRFSAFYPDTIGSRIREVFCYQVGDMTVCNSSPEAITITRWLMTFTAADFDCTPPDSCLNLSTPVDHVPPVVLPSVLPVTPLKIDLKGKKVGNASRQLIIVKGGKRLAGF
jgi:hypothetical protein